MPNLLIKDILISLLVVLLILVFLPTQAQNPTKATKEYPRVGLVLSGGGAKGLAYIYVLKALDSAGLKVDYITGTSIGAVMGGVYAAGNKPDDIEHVASNVDWDDILTDRVPLRTLAIEEKEMNLRYALRMPIRQAGIKLDKSYMEGQGIWTQFTELFFPVLYIKDFNKLPVQFKCVAANIESGEQVTLENGNLLESVRASMAIPVVFPAVNRNDTILVDGGIVRNLPVQEVIDMGSDYTIGISLSQGGFWHTEFTNPMQYIDAMIFYNAARDYDAQKGLCDYFYEYDMQGYTSGSFSHIDDIMNIGKNSLDSLYHKFKDIKDSLDNIYGPNLRSRPEVDKVLSYKMDKISVVGLQDIPKQSFLEVVTFEPGKRYKQEDLQVLVDEVFSTNLYKAVYYNINRLDEDSYELEFKVVPKAEAFINFGLQYSTFEGVNLVAKLKKHNLITRHSMIEIGAAVGKNLRLQTNLIQPIIKSRALGIRPSIFYEGVELDYVEPSNEKVAEYRQRRLELGFQVLTLNNPIWQLATQWKMQRVSIEPNFYQDVFVDGHNTLSSVGLVFQINTLNRVRFPRKGIRINASFEYVYNQKPNLELFSRFNDTLSFDDLNLHFEPYQRLKFSFENYLPLSHKLVFKYGAETNVNFSYQENFVDNYSVGGLQKTFVNQMPFIGLRESKVLTPSFSAIMGQFRYDLFRNINLTFSANYGFRDFVDSSNNYNFKHTIAGYNLGMNYITRLGPLNLNVIYTPRNENWSTLLYFGRLF